MQIRERGEPDPVPVAETRFALARAFGQAGGDRTRAVALAKQARDAYAKVPLLAAKGREIDTWLATHQ